MSTYTEFEALLLVGAYIVTEQSGKEIIEVKSVIDRFQLEPKPNWIRRAISGFQDAGLAKDVATLGDELEQDVWLTAAGIREAERLLNEEEVRIRMPMEEGTAAPASDRIVRFDHNQLAFKEIADGISDVAESIRGANDLDEAERDRLSTSLSAARSLWSATQLKVIQIKIGIILTLEDAAKALGGTAKAVAAALLVDTIKAFIKTHTGVDLDNF